MIDLLKKAEEIVNQSTMATLENSKGGADWVMSLLDEDGYPAASMITAAKSDGFHWIAFCTGVGWNKPIRAKKNPRSCIYLFDEKSFTGISLVGDIEVITDYEVKKQMWYEGLDAGGFFTGPEDEKLCVLLFKPKKYNIFIEDQTIKGAF
ncbi:MAG: pyridoxamine 5'-phosphate oxidase family protein [Clostridia bacterium]|nr:pyridoxamine 5'-phosphate oxidase family protein [Clostridia bacterium]MBQ8420561.1 pyridoxamine 5'-phosphate oxidase family protein [Clostridia bacterium]